MSTDSRDYESEHREVWELLPALVNGTADGAQTRRVERHLDDCADCRAELERERLLRMALSLPAEHAPDVELGLQRLSGRLDQAGRARSSARLPWRSFPHFAGATLVGVGLVELVALAALLIAGTHLLVPVSKDSPSDYRTLSDAARQEVVPVRLRLVFDGARPVAELQSALLAQDLVVVDGPSETGVWSLGFNRKEHDADATARALRRIPGVMFVEPVGLPGS